MKMDVIGKAACGKWTGGLLLGEKNSLPFTKGRRVCGKSVRAAETRGLLVKTLVFLHMVR